MFENGLFASFIPEILMVLAYLFCFVAPGFKTEKQSTELTQNVVHVSNIHSITNSVYVLKINNEFYMGYTEDLRRRIRQHKLKGDVVLVYYESYSTKKLATLREKKLKNYGSAWRALKKRIIA